MVISDLANLARENFPDIANNLSKLSQDPELQKILSQSGTLGGLINMGFAIFNKIRNRLQSDEQRTFVSFIKVTFESAKASIPSNAVSFKNVKSQIELKEIFGLFLSHYSSNYYHLPDHPAITKFRNNIISIMKDNDLENREIQNFIVNFNSTLLINAKKSNEMGDLINNWQLKSTNDKLIKYLEYLTSLLDEPNPVDGKAVSEYYIENKTIVIDSKSWEYHIDNIHEFQQKAWKLDDFLYGDKKREFVGAEFGTGKTNFAKKIAVDCAAKYLRGEDTYIPIYVPLKSNLNNIFNDDSLEDITRTLDKQKILIICDGLDEYEGDPTDLIYKKLPSLVKNEAKTIFTTRLELDFPKKISIPDYYVRLCPFTFDQVNEFFSGSKYNLRDVSFETLKEFGLDPGEISKPLICWMFAIMYSNPDIDLSIRNVSEQSTKRALFFQEVIHSIIVGKHKESINGKDNLFRNKNEKATLRNIAFLASIHKDNLTTKIVGDKLNLSEDEVLGNPIITTYFNLMSTTDKPKRIEFFHRSFFEYLLAESFIESLTFYLSTN